MAKLPAQFSDLEPFNKWSTGADADRIKEINNRTDAELRAFYDAVLPRMDAVVAHLNEFPLDKLPASETALFNLAKMMMEVATIVEHGRSIIAQYVDIARFVPLDETKG
jgi:hypothetical protein